MKSNSIWGQIGYSGAIALVAALVVCVASRNPKAAPNNGAAPATQDTCISCHSDPELLVKNKKLYNYYEDWKLSVHNEAGLSCVDCHGGDATARDKEAAHAGKVLGASDEASAVNFKNIPATCAECHVDIFAGYEKSEHFKHLSVEAGEPQGPNCVTCHGSINTSVLNVSTVADVCLKCHNKATGNDPAVPAKAKDLLHHLLSIERYYRTVAVQGNPEHLQEFFEAIDPIRIDLSVQWHTFDLEAIEEKTESLLRALKKKRIEIRRDQAQRRAQ